MTSVMIMTPALRDYRQVFVDLDGVLADLVGGYKKRFGTELTREADNADWDLVRATPGFYRGLPPMEDTPQLWSFLVQLKHKPIVLTGVPRSIPWAAAEKRAWCAYYLGEDIEVITCFSKDKALHMQPGDVLIDDWDKYRHLWLAAGGQFVLHRSAESSIDELLGMGVGF